jgi:hypothetical protein
MADPRKPPSYTPQTAHKNKLRADVHNRIKVLRIILQETLSSDLERAYRGVWPKEKEQLKKISSQVLKHLDDMLKRLGRLETLEQKEQ